MLPSSDAPGVTMVVVQPVFLGMGGRRTSPVARADAAPAGNAAASSRTAMICRMRWIGIVRRTLFMQHSLGWPDR